MRRRRGFTLIMTVGMMVVLVPMLGLAVDASLLYAIKAKLSAAVDAGALAGARSLNRGMDIGSQADNARQTARNFFNANFPDRHLNTSNLQFSANVAETAYKTRTVQIEATVEAPVYFLRLLGLGSTPIRAEGMASRRDVNVLLILDRSTSLSQAGACGTLKAAAAAFTEKFSEGRDRLGLLTFGGSSRVDFSPNTNFKSASPSVSTLISQINCNGYTGTAQALWTGYQSLSGYAEPGALNLLVFFTDGVPNGITAQFPVKRVTDTRANISSPWNQVNTAPSTCKDAAGRSYPNASWNPGPKLGFVGQTSAGATNGATNGIMRHNALSISNNNEVVIEDSSGCKMGPSGGTSNVGRLRQDISHIPNTDYYGNSTSGYKTVAVYSGGPYSGLKRVDSPAALVNSSINAADDAARRIREDTYYNMVIYSIGLGGTVGEPADHEFLRRVSNDLASPIYDPSKQAGMYVYAPGPAQLSEAFARVASEILRLAL